MLSKIAELLIRAEPVVVLTGAGISAESGVPTFRGQQGLWKKYRPEELATPEAFRRDPSLVWEWYNWRRGLMAEVEPNPGHFALVELARICPDFTLITQNVDGLHARAGSVDVIEMHGNIYRSKCFNCNRLSEHAEIDPTAVPTCAHCGGLIRPDVVWFGETLADDVIRTAWRKSESARVFFSVGTSALVYPAASLPMVARQTGAVLVEINPEPTPLSEMANFVVQGASGEVLPEIVALAGEITGKAKD